jgi:hypothetical protein
MELDVVNDGNASTAKIFSDSLKLFVNKIMNGTDRGQKPNLVQIHNELYL